MKTYKSKRLVYGAWALIAALMATVVKYATAISWPISITLASVTGLCGCLIAIYMCRFTDKQKLSRLSLIIFCGVGLMLTVVFPGWKGTSFDETGLKLFLFTAAGLILTAFFLPEKVQTSTPVGQPKLN